MKIMKSSVIKKIIIILVLISIICSLCPKSVNADLGGILAWPILTLITHSVGVFNNFLWNVLNKDQTITSSMISSVDTGHFVEPNDIFCGKYKIFSANIFSSSGSSNANGGASPGAKDDVEKIVAGVYYVLRNMCGLVMLAGLIYTGIRILLSSNIPTKKTQYLILLQDWLIRDGSSGSFAPIDDRNLLLL